MRAVLCALAWLTALSAAGDPPSNPQDARIALDAWLSHQVSVNSWSAPVRQLRELKALARPLENDGSVIFARPGRFRWELGTPPRTIVVGTAAGLTIAYPRLEQVERYDYDDAVDPSLRQVIDLLEVGFPSSAEAFLSRYELLGGRLTEGLWVFELRPDDAGRRRLLETIVLEVDASDQRLAATEFRFPDGSRMRNEFGVPEVDGVVDAARFELDVPAHWQTSRPLAD